MSHCLLQTLQKSGYIHRRDYDVQRQRNPLFVSASLVDVCCCVLARCISPGNHTLEIIANHSRNNAKARATGLEEQPLFLFHAFHLAHSPLQVVHILRTERFRPLRFGEERQQLAFLTVPSVCTIVLRRRFRRTTLTNSSSLVMSVSPCCCVVDECCRPDCCTACDTKA